MILVNFKIYKETFGEGAVRLAKICKKAAEKTKVKIIPVVSAVDVYRIKNEVGIEVVVQQVDEYHNGAKTGFISPEQVKQAGAMGALINHSEQREKSGTIKKKLAQWPNNFWSIVCIQSWGQVETWAKKLQSTYVAYEPKYLIGNKDKSVVSECRGTIEKLAEKYKGRLIIGAGIHSQEDIVLGRKMGAKGFLVASKIVLANDPEKELTSLAEGFLL